MDTLRKLVLAMASMSPSELRNAHQLVVRGQVPDEVKEVVLKLIDLFISTGVNPQRRAWAAACLLAIDEAASVIDERPSAARPKPASARSGWVGWAVILAIVIMIWLFSR